MVSTTRKILSDKGEIRDNILNRAEHCKTKVMPPDEIANVGMFIKKHVKGLS